VSKVKQVFLHTIVWMAFLLFFVFIGSRSSSISDPVVIFVYFGIVNIGLFYLNLLYILPRFLDNRKYLVFAFSILSAILLSGLLKYGLAKIFDQVVLVHGPAKQYYRSFQEYYWGSVLTSTFFVFISTAVKFATDWFLNEKIKKDLEKDKLTAELAFLKSQINPHFLFNSLNNIYSLAYQGSDKTPAAILKLSEIMRYMLQESNEVKVELSQELRYLNNYIELQKLRFKNEAYVNLSIAGEGTHQYIAPLILIAFVENAFKHGLATEADNPIKIVVVITNGHLQFDIWNKKSTQNKDTTSGIGLNNVKRRLDLLYPGKYKLNIENTKNFYSSELSLDL